jgi:hypothetical protein
MALSAVFEKGQVIFPLPTRPKRDGIAASLAARAANMGWNFARVHSIDFFAF